MRLEIIIPYYKEGEEIIRPLLDSIKKYVGCHTIIVHDGYENPLSEEFLSNYDVEWHEFEHGGISVARNHGLDLATAEYVMFCDDDDEFIDYIDLGDLDDEVDVITSPFIEKSIMVRDLESTFIHGKAFRREFILNNDIRFADELLVIEDGYFVGMALTLGNVRRVKRIFYRWNERKDSTSADDDFVWKNWTMAIRAKELLIDRLLGWHEDAQAMATLQIFVETAWHYACMYEEDNRIDYFLKKYSWFERSEIAEKMMNEQWGEAEDFWGWYKRHSE